MYCFPQTFFEVNFEQEDPPESLKRETMTTSQHLQLFFNGSYVRPKQILTQTVLALITFTKLHQHF